MRDVISLLIILMLVSVVLVGCSERGNVQDSDGGSGDDQNGINTGSDDLSDSGPDLVGEDEVDIGEMV